MRSGGRSTIDALRGKVNETVRYWKRRKEGIKFEVRNTIQTMRSVMQLWSAGLSYFSDTIDPLQQNMIYVIEAALATALAAHRMMITTGYGAAVGVIGSAISVGLFLRARMDLLEGMENAQVQAQKAETLARSAMNLIQSISYQGGYGTASQYLPLQRLLLSRMLTGKGE
jgi:hypothetical protein